MQVVGDVGEDHLVPLGEAGAHLPALRTGAAQLDGQMLDEAVAVAARRTLSKIGA